MSYIGKSRMFNDLGLDHEHRLKVILSGDLVECQFFLRESG
jgi:hypothetical protein